MALIPRFSGRQTNGCLPILSEILLFFSNHMPRAINYAICAHLHSVSFGTKVPNPLFAFTPAGYIVAELQIPTPSRLERALFFPILLCPKGKSP